MFSRVGVYQQFATCDDQRSRQTGSASSCRFWLRTGARRCFCSFPTLDADVTRIRLPALGSSSADPLQVLQKILFLPEILFSTRSSDGVLRSDITERRASSGAELCLLQQLHHAWETVRLSDQQWAVPDLRVSRRHLNAPSCLGRSRCCCSACFSWTQSVVSTTGWAHRCKD